MDNRGCIKNELTSKNNGWPEYSISVTEESLNYLNYVQGLFYKVFNTKGNLYFNKDLNGSWYTLRITSKPIHRFFTSTIGFPEGKKVGFVRVPRIIEKCNIELQKQFIRGFFDGEGAIGITTKSPYLDIGQASYDNSPPQVLVWINNKLSNIGLKFAISRYKNFWRLRTASKPTISNFYKEIGSNHDKKINKFKAIALFEYGKSKDRAGNSRLSSNGTNEAEAIL